ncbi:MAG: BlaI/MecI/CopY family transcriptional regulator [Chitinophagaceae bacterium]
MAKNIKKLTTAEAQIMQVLWDLKKGFVNDIIARLSKPKPAYSTVSTIVRILVEKGFIGYKAYGKTYEYFPVISKEQYRDYEANKLLTGYYEDSLGSLVSSFVENKNMDLEEADKIIRLLQQFKKDQK